MALLNKLRKDIKKSSYYVWFLGAQESKGLRGSEYILPVLKGLVEREKVIEPFKITLQVSQKGLKIVQNVGNLSGSKKVDFKPNKNDVIKHFIPHHALTSVYQEDDVVACVLLLYNPVTRCPVHVHAYRCDTIETASLLTQQLMALVDKPENQRKMSEIETRLHAKGLLLPTVPRVNIPKRVNSSGSDGISTTSPASESSGGSSTGGQERLSHLYDSLAAELREKLGLSTDNRVTHAPILLPPRDYDTVHRQKGNLTGIELRKCLNENIIGAKSDAKTEKIFLKTSRLNRVMDSSGGSSGIGSDHPSSPDDTSRNLSDRHNFSQIQGNLLSDEEWAEPRRRTSAELPMKHTINAELDLLDQPSSINDSPRNCGANNISEYGVDSMIEKNYEPSKIRVPIENFRKRNERGSLSPVGVVAPRRRVSPTEAQHDPVSCKKRIPGLVEKANEKKNDEPRKTQSPQAQGTMKLSPQERFLDAKTKFLLLEKERLKDQEQIFQNIEKKKNSTVEVPISPEIIKTRPHWSNDIKVDHDRAGLARRGSFFDQQPAVLYGQSNSKENLQVLLDKRQRISRSDSCAALLSYQSHLSRDADEKPRTRKSGEYMATQGISQNPRESGSFDNNDDIQNRIDRGDMKIRRRIAPERRYQNFPKSNIRLLSDEDDNMQCFKQFNTRNDNRESSQPHFPQHRGVSSQAKYSNDNYYGVPYEKEIKMKPNCCEEKIKSPSNYYVTKEPKRNMHSDQIDKRERPKGRNFGNYDYQERRTSVGAYQMVSSDCDNDDDWRTSHQRSQLRKIPSVDYNRENPETDLDVSRPTRIRMENLPARYRHSFVDQGSANSRLLPHDVVHRTNSNVSSTRVGIATVHLY